MYNVENTNIFKTDPECHTSVRNIPYEHIAQTTWNTSFKVFFYLKMYFIKNDSKDPLKILYEVMCLLPC